MSAVERIESVLDTGLLIPQLLLVPQWGATTEEIQIEEELVGRTLCRDHVAILRRWNGIALDVLRLFGCGESSTTIGRLSSSQNADNFGVDGSVVVGSDAAGFTYLQAPNQRVYSFDSDGGAFELLATSLDDFIDRVVFGPDAALFAGQEWLAELRSAGIVN